MSSLIQTTTLWLVLFSLTTLTSALLLAHGPTNHSRASGIAAVIAALAALRAAIAVVRARPTWQVVPMNQTAAIGSENGAFEEEPTTFQCPWMPLVPLAGMAANLVMMGSLPLRSWLWILIWLAAGMVIYLCYGIHHSNLQQVDVKGQSALSGEARPLLWWQKEAGNVSSLEAVDNGDKTTAAGIQVRDYDSALQVSLHGLHARSVSRTSAGVAGGEEGAPPSFQQGRDSG